MNPQHDPTDTAAFADEQAVAVSQEKEARRKEIEDVRWLMAHKQGRRLAWRLLKEAGIYRPTFTGNSTTFFNEGKRCMGLFLLAEINDHAIDQFVVMMKEHKQNE